MHSPELMALAQALPALRVECPTRCNAEEHACICRGLGWVPTEDLSVLLDALDGAKACVSISNYGVSGPWMVAVRCPPDRWAYARGDNTSQAVQRAACAALGLVVADAKEGQGA